MIQLANPSPLQPRVVRNLQMILLQSDLPSAGDDVLLRFIGWFRPLQFQLQNMCTLS